MKPNKSVLEIDPNNLDVDAREHPKLTWEWGQELAKARMNAKGARLSAKVIKAEVEKEIRNNPSDFDLEKITDKSVEAAVAYDSRVVQAESDQIEAEYQRDILEVFFQALGERKDGIEDNVRLHGQMYFSKPSLSGEDKERSRIRGAQEAEIGSKIRRPKPDSK